MLTNPIFYIFMCSLILFFPNFARDHKALTILSLLVLIFYDYKEALLLFIIIIIIIKLSQIKFSYALSTSIFLIFAEKILIYLDYIDKINGLSFALITILIILKTGVNIGKSLSISLFFPHILAGPIIHKYQNVREKFNNRVLLSTFLFSLGNIILVLSFQILNQFESYIHSFHIYAVSWFYLMGLFANFFGYSLIALSYGYLLNIKLPLNFNAPGLTTSPSNFWDRWHISLSRVFAEIVFPNLRLFLNRYIRMGSVLVCIFITLMISGIWHGIGFGFIIWVLFHFISFLVLGKSKFPKVINAILFWILTLPSWYFFSLGDSSINEIMASINIFNSEWDILSLGSRFLVSISMVSLIFFIPFHYLAFKMFIYKNNELTLNISNLHNPAIIVIIFLLFTSMTSLWVFGEIDKEYFIYAGF